MTPSNYSPMKIHLQRSLIEHVNEHVNGVLGVNGLKGVALLDGPTIYQKLV